MFILCLSAMMLHFNGISSDLCGNYVYKNVDAFNLTFVPAYTCPYRNLFPQNYTRCCDNMTLLQCCQAKRQIDHKKSASIFTHTMSQDLFFLLVTLTILSIIGLIILITCFIWDKCPLYKKFQFKKHYKGHVIEYYMESDKPNPTIKVKSLSVNDYSARHVSSNNNYQSLLSKGDIS